MWSFFGYKETVKENVKPVDRSEVSNSYPPSTSQAHDIKSGYKNDNYHYAPYLQQMPQLVYIDPSQYNPSKNNISQGISSDEEEEASEAVLKYGLDEIGAKALYLQTHRIDDIIDKLNFIDVIPQFPKTLNIDNELDFMELRSWLYNTTDLLNIWHIHRRKSKLDYTNAMKYLTFKLKEVVLYYYDYKIDYNEVDDVVHRGDKIGDKDTKSIKKKLFHFKNSGNEHIQTLLDNYPTRFYRDIPEKEPNFYNKGWCPCKSPKFNEIESIKYSIDKMQLTEEQYNIFRYEYLYKLRYLERRKMKFKRLFCFSNISLQLGSVILPTLITIKDNKSVQDIPNVKKLMDISAITLSVIMGVITNLTVFFKVNQRYSLYTQYDNKLKQEMRRFITYSEKYNDTDVKDVHRLFPQFSLSIENYIEELSNQEYDYIVGNKEKDMGAFDMKTDIYNQTEVRRSVVFNDKPLKDTKLKRGPGQHTPRVSRKKINDDEDKLSVRDKVIECEVEAKPTDAIADNTGEICPENNADKNNA